jgi:uncharacterized protein YwgA
MDLYALAKFVELAGKVDKRKRFQKCVYLLQKEGLDFGAEYFLHFYGPYSQNVAEAIDDLCKWRILEETTCGGKYSYTLTQEGAGVLADVEKARKVSDTAMSLSSYAAEVKRLVNEKVWVLELAATLLFYFREENDDWDTAKSKTSDFKKVKANSPIWGRVEEFARSIADKGDRKPTR